MQSATQLVWRASERETEHATDLGWLEGFFIKQCILGLFGGSRDAGGAAVDVVFLRRLIAIRSFNASAHYWGSIIFAMARLDDFQLARLSSLNKPS